MTCRICPRCGVTMDCGGRGTVCDRCEGEPSLAEQFLALSKKNQDWIIEKFLAGPDSDG